MLISRKTYYSAALLLFFTVAVCSAGQAQPASNDLERQVDELVAEGLDEHGPGSAVLVVKDGKILLNKGYGLAELEHQIPIGPNTVFDLASVSKQFAGFAIATLLEEGKISLEDDIRKYIPELPDFGHPITVEHLLHHTSGIRDWTNTLVLAGWSFDDVISFDQILRMAYLQRGLNFEPGSEYNYSNTGYNLLAELVQRVSGLSFRDWTNRHILQPLGMTNSRFMDDHTEVIANRARGYFRDQNGIYHASPNNLTALGSSSMYSTTTDLAKWVTELDQPHPERKAVIERMFQTRQLNDGKENDYAYGLVVNAFHGTRAINHSGSWASFRTYLLVLPEKHLSVVVLNNYAGNPAALARTIASWYVPEPQMAGTQAGERGSAAVPVSEQVLDHYAGTYRLGPGWYVTLTRQGDQLWTQATNEDRFPMTPLANNLFRIDAYGGRTMEFFTEKSGDVSHLVYNGMVCPKVEEATVADPVDLQAYTGRYLSEELRTEYEVVLEGDSLKLRHHRHGELDLRHAWAEDFTGSRWFIQSVEFFRDADGAIQGFRVTSGRARNQPFRKVVE